MLIRGWLKLRAFYPNEGWKLNRPNTVCHVSGNFRGKPADRSLSAMDSESLTESWAEESAANIILKLTFKQQKDLRISFYAAFLSFSC